MFKMLSRVLTIVLAVAILNYSYAYAETELAESISKVESQAENSIDYSSLVDVEEYFINNSSNITDETIQKIMWPKFELYSLMYDKNDTINAKTKIASLNNKSIKEQGYVWSYDYENPSILKNQGSTVLYNNFDCPITCKETRVFVRAYVIYDNYIMYSNQRQVEVMPAKNNSLMFARNSSESKVVFKDTGDDLDKFTVGLLYKEVLDFNLNTNYLPTKSAFLVIKGLAKNAQVYVNNKLLSAYGSHTNNYFTALRVPISFIKKNNLINIHVDKLDFVKVDAISLILDEGEQALATISDINLEDWSINFNSSSNSVDISANTSLNSINVAAGLKLVSNIRHQGDNFGTEDSFTNLVKSDSSEKHTLGFKDSTDSSQEDGVWDISSIVLQDKKAIVVKQKSIFYEDNVGIKNFTAEFIPEVNQYTNQNIKVKVKVLDHFKKPFKHLQLPNGDVIEAREAEFIADKNAVYSVKLVEPNNRETVFNYSVANIDKVKPTISLVGDNTVGMLEGEQYTELGVIMADNYSGCTSVVPVVNYNGLNTYNAKRGQYVIDYKITDCAGNEASTSRTVNVLARPLNVVTGDITKTSTLVKLAGNISSLGNEQLVERGFVWGFNTPTVNSNDGKVSFTDNIENIIEFNHSIELSSLAPNIEFKARAYAKSTSGKIVYGTVKKFYSNTKSYPTYQFTDSSYSVSSGSTFNLTVTRNKSDEDAKVYYRTVPGSALPNIHYEPKTSYVDFNNGILSKSISIKTLVANTYEFSCRSFYVEIFEVDGKGNIAQQNRVTVYIKDKNNNIRSYSSNDTYRIYGRKNVMKRLDKNGNDNFGGIPIGDDHNYYKEQGAEIWGRAAFDVDMVKCKLNVSLKKVVNGSDVSLGSTEISGDKYKNDIYISTTGYKVTDASKLRLDFVVSENNNVFNNDYCNFGFPTYDLKVIDNTKPYIKSFYTLNANYQEGDTIYIAVQFNEIVNFSDSTKIKLNLKVYDENNNAVPVVADYVTGINTDTLVFSYVVLENQHNSVLEMTDSKLSGLNTIEDILGNSAEAQPTSTLINDKAHIAYYKHNIQFSPNGNSSNQSKQATVVNVSSIGSSSITSCKYLWAEDSQYKSEGFKDFSNGDELFIEGVTGSYYLHILTIDSVGDKTYRVSEPFMLNNEEPSFTLQPNTNQYTNQPIIVSITDIPSDVNIAKKQFKPGFYSIANFGSGTDIIDNNFSVTTNGLYTVMLETETGLKYINRINVVYIDTEKPTISIDTDGSNGSAINRVKVNLSCNDTGVSKLKNVEYAWSKSNEMPNTGFSSALPNQILEQLEAGTWFLHIKAVDNAYNTTVFSSLPYIVENDPPSLSVTGENPNVWTKDSIVLTVTASKNNLSHVVLPNLSEVLASSEGEVNTTFEVSKNGFYRFLAIDKAGNIAEATYIVSKIDQEAPKIDVIRSTTDYTNGTVELKITATDNTSPIYDVSEQIAYYDGVGSIEISSINGNEYQPYGGEIIATVNTNGEYFIKVKDGLGNEGIRKIDINNIDNTAPVVEADNTDYGSKTSPIQVKLSIKDKELGVGGTIKYRASSSSNTPTDFIDYSGSVIEFNIEGSYYIHYIARDTVGNESRGYFGPYTYSISAPSIEIDASQSTTYKKLHYATINVNYNVHPSGQISYCWSDSANSFPDFIPVSNGAIINKKNEDGMLYLHVKLECNSLVYRAYKPFYFDNTAPQISLKGGQVVELPYKQIFIEPGISYTDNQDMWPSYIKPDYSVIDNNTLGSYVIKYRVIDSANNSAVVSRTVKVVDITSPILKDLYLTIQEDEVKHFSTADFTEVFSDDVSGINSITITSLPTTGELYLNNTLIKEQDLIERDKIASLSYIPKLNWFGADTLQFKASDDSNNISNEAAIKFEVTSYNDIPVASDDTATTAEDKSVTINVRDNDTDIETATNNLVIQNVSNPAHGTTHNNNDGSIFYTPDPNFNGQDYFIYQVKDEGGKVNTARVDITVTPVEDKPTKPGTISYSLGDLKEGYINKITWSESIDFDDDNIEYIVEFYNGSSYSQIYQVLGISYYHMLPHITTNQARYRVKAYDNKGYSDYQTGTDFKVSIIKPQITDLNLELNEDSSIEISKSNLQSVFNLGVNQLKAVIVHSLPVHGELLFNNTAVILNKEYDITNTDSFNYKPYANYYGTDKVTYHVLNQHSEQSNTGSINLTIVPINDEPIAMADSVEVNEDINIDIDVIDNDSDIETSNQDLQINITDSAEHGTVKVNNNNTINYLPDANYFGTDCFKYSITDEHAGVAEALVTIKVNPVNDEPKAPVTIAYNNSPKNEGDTVNIVWSVAQDYDADELQYFLEFYNGKQYVEIYKGNKNSYKYILPHINTHKAHFRVKAFDSEFYSDYKVGSEFEVKIVNPAVTDMNIQTNEDDSYQFTANEFLSCFNQGVNSLTEIKLITLPVNAKLLLADNDVQENQLIKVDELNSLLYQPKPNYFGQDSFTYVAYNQHNEISNVGKVNIVVSECNDIPVAEDDEFSTQEDTLVTYNILQNDSDIETSNQDLVINITENSKKGSLSLGENGIVSYTPNSNYNGSDSFSYSITDEHGASASAHVDIIVSAINDLPSPVPYLRYKEEPITEGNPKQVKWGHSTDADNSDLSYYLEFYDGSSYEVVYQGKGTSYNHAVPSISTKNAKYRIRAYDGTDYGSYLEGPCFTIEVIDYDEIKRNAPVLVNENPKYVGKVKKLNTDTTLITVEEKRLKNVVTQEKQGSVVTIQNNKKCATTIGSLSADLMQNMINKKDVIELKTHNAKITIPTEHLMLNSYIKKLNADKAEDVKVSFKIETKKQAVINNDDISYIGKVINFTVEYEYQDEVYVLNEFEHYVERLIELPKGISCEKITTATVIDSDGRIRHIPTEVIEVSGKYYAKVNSLVNGDFTIMYNPLKYDDVKHHWAENDINDMGSRLVVVDAENNRVSPNAQITRAEFASMVISGLGLTPSKEQQSFNDVKFNKWFAEFVESAFNYNIISGYQDGSFKPTEYLTREQAMSIVIRATKLTGLNSELSQEKIAKIYDNFKDSDQVSSWAKRVVAECIESDIIKGKESKDGKLIASQDQLTRAEAIVIIKRLLKKSKLI